MLKVSYFGPNTTFSSTPIKPKSAASHWWPTTPHTNSVSFDFSACISRLCYFRDPIPVPSRGRVAYCRRRAGCILCRVYISKYGVAYLNGELVSYACSGEMEGVKVESFFLSARARMGLGLLHEPSSRGGHQPSPRPTDILELHVYVPTSRLLPWNVSNALRTRHEEVSLYHLAHHVGYSLIPSIFAAFSFPSDEVPSAAENAESSKHPLFNK